MIITVVPLYLLRKQRTPHKPHDETLHDDCKGYLTTSERLAVKEIEKTSRLLSVLMLLIFQMSFPLCPCQSSRDFLIVKYHPCSGEGVKMRDSMNHLTPYPRTIMFCIMWKVHALASAACSAVLDLLGRMRMHAYCLYKNSEYSFDFLVVSHHCR